jgi:hypothetical protein
MSYRVTAFSVSLAHVESIQSVSFLIKSAELKRLLGRPKRRWENNIQIHHTTNVCRNVDWFCPVQGRV